MTWRATGKMLQGWGLPDDTLGDAGDTYWDLHTNYQFGPKTGAEWGRLVQDLSIQDVARFEIDNATYEQMQRRRYLSERAKDHVILFKDVDADGLSLRDFEMVLNLAEDGLDAAIKRAPRWQEGLTGDAEARQIELMDARMARISAIRKIRRIIAYLCETNFSLLDVRRDAP